MKDSIYEFVKIARDEYYSRTIEVIPGYEFSQHETLRTIELFQFEVHHRQQRQPEAREAVL